MKNIIKIINNKKESTYLFKMALFLFKKGKNNKYTFS